MARRFAPRRPWQAAFVLAAIPESDTGHPPPRPRIVKRVLDAMHGDPSRPWTAGDMAEVAGVSIRRLQEGFRDYVGASPREFLTDIRLTRVREDLLRGADGSTVTDVAMRWGFTHTGRFAAAYRHKYGQSPSETLRGKRAADWTAYPNCPRLKHNLRSVGDIERLHHLCRRNPDDELPRQVRRLAVTERQWGSHQTVDESP